MAAPSEDEKGLLRFENAARALFGADNAARGRASTFLAPYTASGSKIKQLIWVFENYEKVRFSCIYALTFAARALLKLITQFIDVKEEIKSPDSLRNWMIDQIFRERSNEKTLPNPVIGLLIQCIGRLVKIGWPKVYSLRTPTLLLEAYTNLKGQDRKQFFAVKILTEIVDAMASPYKGENLGDHRMRNQAFQQSMLKDIVRFAFDALAKDPKLRVVDMVLELARQCLGFSFATESFLNYADIPQDEMETLEKIRFPNGWRQMISDGFLARPVITIVQKCSNNNLETAKKCLRLLQLMAAMGEEVFTSAPAHTSHISTLAKCAVEGFGTFDASPGVFHEWCLFVVRLITHAYMERSSQSPELSRLLEKASILTMRALKGGEPTQHAAQFLIQMWASLALTEHMAKLESTPQQMMGEMGDFKSKYPASNFLKGALPSLVAETVNMMTSLVKKAALDGEADRVMSEGDFQLFLEYVPILVRQSYGKHMPLIMGKLRTTCVAWKESPPPSDANRLKALVMIEAEIACLTMIAASILENPNLNPLSINFPKEDLILDGQAAILLMELMVNCTKRIKEAKAAGGQTHQREVQALRAIDMALLTFIDSFLLHCRLTSTAKIRDHRDLLVCAGLGRLVPMFDEEGFDDLDFLISMQKDEWDTMQSVLHLSSGELRRLAFEVQRQKNGRDDKDMTNQRSGPTTLRTIRKKPVMYQVISTICKRDIGQEDTISRFFCKVMESLTFWSSDVVTVTKSLKILDSMVCGRETAHTIRRAKMTQALLSREASGFQFLERFPQSKLRSRFYAILGRLLFCNENRKHLKGFSRRFDAQFEFLESAIRSANNANIRHVKAKTIGLCRDLTGLIDVCEEKQDFESIFRWLYPEKFQLLIRLLETWYRDGNVANALLKLISSVVHNKRDRIRFPTVDASGIKLFKEAAKVVTMFCSHLPMSNEGGGGDGLGIISSEDNDKDSFDDMMKGLQHCLSVLTRALSGNYVCFEVFELYNDQCVTTSITALLKVCMALRPGDISAYPKVFRRVADFLYEVLEEHIEQAVIQTPEVFGGMLMSLIDGVCGTTDPVTISASAGGLDCIFSFYYAFAIRRIEGNSVVLRKKREIARKLGRILSDRKCKRTVERVLPVLFNLLVFESKTTLVWSLSRPMATCIACDAKGFLAFRKQFTLGQPENERKTVDGMFDLLVEGITFDTSHKSKNQFSRNLSRFCKAVKKMPRLRPVMV